MKYLKKFETFTNDEDRGQSVEAPKFNPATRLKAKNYIDVIFGKGSGSEVNDVCKEIGEEAPKTDEELDALKDKAIQYFIDNPERIKEFDGGFKSIPYNSGDGVVRTNNIGGVHE